MSQLDLVIFGASGYTGKFVARELAAIYQKENLTWGIAGRSRQKLEDVLKAVSTELKIDLTNIEILIVDINDVDSIKRMCERSKIILNCVGPYRFYGEQIIKECVDKKTHHLDVSGEPEYLERIQLKYNEKALENNVYIIGSCGFDSVPADLGLIYTKKNFKNDLNHVESYLLFDFKNQTSSFNFATWESAVYGFASSSNLAKIRKELFKTRLPKSNYPAPERTNMLGFFYDNNLAKYCLNFIGSDKSVVQRTQYFNYNVLEQRPIVYKPYFTISNLFYTSIFILWGLTFSILANYKFGRYLLLKFYKFFSFGLATKKDTTAEQMKNNSFRIQFRGAGFNDRLENKNEQFNEPPKRFIITEMGGPEPGYVSTSRILLNCALIILKEPENIPVKGGVLTPGSAFCNSSLIERLQQNGFTFKVIKNDSN